MVHMNPDEPVGSTERDAMVEVIASTYVVFSDDPGEVADAILAEFLPAYTKRVRAEQRETDARIVEALSAGEHTVIAAIREASDERS